ncbi:MAG: hypothetical protein A2X28_08385 [Elusimicrobia bacterium GWA2_56_46]|nr:MAG: hypothetical protein A2X28_08385 [Elusimicrobia bacterium GWA2_56_46]OGR55156.1 MAG: hypothetical protein A2X39_01290 [Elusimicrobia bacterium GWC2_56_31]HBB66866.1 hypothetical protein [Elusimicrobiota bacterium]HBW23774.1 hypothetical protein [Elusimicrobiota bacterium]
MKDSRAGFMEPAAKAVPGLRPGLLACAFAALLFPVRPAPAADLPPPVTVGEIERTIKKDDLEVVTRVTGLATAQDTYDVYAPFDGRVEDVMVELFDLVGADRTLARMISTDMAALLDSSGEANKKQTEERWQDVYDYYPIKPEFQGIVTNIYAEPRTRISKGDRLFTVAKKVVILGRNTEKLYSGLAPGMTAELAYAKDSEIKLKTRLVNFMPLKGSPYFNRLWLEVSALQSGLRIGGQFDGYLLVGRSENTLLVPRTSLLDRSGRKYLILEVETGLVTETQTEILRPGAHFLEPKYPSGWKADAEETKPAKAAGESDGKNKKTD